jgi:uncharacterized protein YcbK (DUF882 family)
MSVKTYSKDRQGNDRLSVDFKVDEFACNDGSDEILVDSNLVTLLQSIREHFKRSVVLNSGYRTVGYNRRIGGASNSFHTKGMAADFNVAGYSPQSVRRIIESKVIKGVDPEKIGLGSYANFTHIDCRGYRSRW